MVSRYTGGIIIGSPDSTTLGINAQGMFSAVGVTQARNTVVTNLISGSYGGTPTANATSATYVLVAGGQSGSTNFPGGGLTGTDYGAGGGGGEVLQGTITGITSGAAVTITIGGGGTAPASTSNPGANGNLGSNSSISGTGFATVTARRGGNSNAGDYNAGTGGSSGNGNAGATGVNPCLGGGGGSGGVGLAVITNGTGVCGQGGPGTNVTFANLPTKEYGGGGGGGSAGAQFPGKASVGLSGGAGGSYNTFNDTQARGGDGTVNTGGGGGGHGLGSTRAGSVSGNGGSGRAMIQVLTYNGTTTYYTPAATGTYTRFAYISGSNVYHVFDFTGSGTLTF